MRPLLLIIFISTILTFCNSAKIDPTTSEIYKDTILTLAISVDREVVDTLLYIQDTVIHFDNKRLTFQKEDSVYIPELYKDFQYRQTIIEKNDNSFMAAKELEAYLSKGQGEHFKRSGDTLFLNLSNGKKVSLIDNSKEGDEEEHYTYENYFSQPNIFIIYVQLYEGNNYLLVNRTNGNKKYIIGRAYPSPSGSKLLAINEDLEAGYSFNGIQLLTKQKDTFTTQLTIDAGNWAPVDVKWLNENNFVLKVKKLKDNVTDYTTEFYKLSIK